MADQWLAEIDTPKGQGKLNGYLAKQSYIVGYTPSQEDVKVYLALQDVPNKFSGLKRWYNHIGSFTEEERNRFGREEEEHVHVPAGSVTTKVEEPKVEEPVDEDFDMFGGDEDPEAAEKLKQEREQQRLDALATEKPKKKIIERSNIVFNIKPAEADTNIQVLEDFVRGIQMEGLDWKASEHLDLAYDIKTLKIACNIIDEFVSVDDIEDIIKANEELVSSIEILTFAFIMSSISSTDTNSSIMLQAILSVLIS